MPLLSAGYPKGIYGVGLRDQLFPGEDEYFKSNPHVAGMAAEDNKVILNPYSKISDKEKEAVLRNEAARVHMRSGLMPKPNYDLTPDQAEAFKTYGNGDADAIKQTIAARIFSGDPSAKTPTAAQIEYVNQLKQFLGAQ